MTHKLVDSIYIIDCIYTGSVINAAGDIAYYKDNKLHRENEPAVLTADHKQWYIEGERHRTDGPAIERSNGDKFWYHRGALHRVNGPAIESDAEGSFWFFDNYPHREDGPAIEYPDGEKEWVFKGTFYGNHFTNETWAEFVKKLKENDDE